MKAPLPRSPRAVGIAMTGFLLLLVLVAAALTVIPWGHHTYRADFARSGGLRAGDEVRIAGVGVGKVRSVQLDGAQVEVTFTVKDDVELGRLTRAEVKLATLLGNKYLELYPEGTGELPDDRIPLAQTHVTFDVQEAIQAGGTALGKLDADKIQRALRVTANAYRGTPAAIRATLDGLGRVSRQLAGRRNDLEALMTGASQVVDTLQARSGDIVRLMDSSDQLLAEIVARRQALHDLIVGTRAMARELSGLVQDNVAAIRPFLDHLRAVTDMLEDRASDIDGALRTIGPAARYFVNASGNGPYLDAQDPYVAPDNALCRAGVIQGCG